VGERDRQRPWLNLASAGFEIAAAVGGFAALGWWIDRRRGTAPWGLLIGALLGLVGGLYNLIKAALVSGRAADTERAASRKRQEEER
jgi:F0F1-type ATP synthase assembly protein I